MISQWGRLSLEEISPGSLRVTLRSFPLRGLLGAVRCRLEDVKGPTLVLLFIGSQDD